MIFNGKDDDARTVWEKAKKFLEDFRVHNLLYPPLIAKVIINVKWKKPRVGTVEVNAGIGILVHDCGGLVKLGGCTYFIETLVNYSWVEIEAVKRGVIWAKEKNFNLL